MKNDLRLDVRDVFQMILLIQLRKHVHLLRFIAVIHFKYVHIKLNLNYNFLLFRNGQ